MKQSQLHLSIRGYLKGWDDALMGKNNCPYSRRDWQERWLRGHQDCLENRPLPVRVKLFLGIFDNEVADYLSRKRKS